MHAIICSIESSAAIDNSRRLAVALWLGYVQQLRMRLACVGSCQGSILALAGMG